MCRAFLTMKPRLKSPTRQTLPPLPRPSNSKPSVWDPFRSIPISIDHAVLSPLIKTDLKFACGVSLTTSALVLSGLYQARNGNAATAAISALSRAKRACAEKIKDMSGELFPAWFRLESSSRGIHERISLAEWSVCRLDKVESLSDEYNKYTFVVPASSGSQLDLDLAQEVRNYLFLWRKMSHCVKYFFVLSQLQICSVDAKGRPLKGAFFLASPPATEGFFEIVCTSSGALTSGTSIPLELQFMDVGNELAIKAGKKRLLFPVVAGEAEISALSVLASGMGILPTLQLLREVLAEPQSSSVQEVEVVWINDAKKDFILNEELAALEKRHGGAPGAGGRLHVTRVVDREAGNADTLLNDQVGSAVAPYRPGRLAVVMAEGAVASKAGQLFSSRGYPRAAIATLAPP